MVTRRAGALIVEWRSSVVFRNKKPENFRGNFGAGLRSENDGCRSLLACRCLLLVFRLLHVALLPFTSSRLPTVYTGPILGAVLGCITEGIVY